MIPRHVLLPLPERRAAEPLARAWLAAQWQRDATRLPLHRDPRGRPRLAAPMDDCDAGWSHSGGWLLLACGRGLRLGCDLERERPRPNARALARRFFHPAEADALDDGPEAQAQAGFLRLWCAKEALLKAHGHGLAFGLDRLRFGFEADGLRLLECDPRLGTPTDWRLREWQPMPGFRAALAWHAWPAANAGAAILPK